MGFAAGALWELYEWFANNVLGASILVSYDDTIADLLMGGCGLLVAGLGLVAWAARRQQRGKVSAGPPRRVADDETAYVREE